MSFSYKQIAKAAGLSISTVHRILTGANKEIWASSSARAEKVRKIAEKHGFRPNAAARSMRLKRTDTIGVVIKYRAGRQMIDPSLFETIMGISYVLENSGRMMNLVRIHEDFSKDNLPRAFREKLLDGVIVMGDMPKTIYSYIANFFKYHVFIETNYYGEFNCVRRNEALSVGLAVEHLVQNGRKRLIYIGPQPESENSHFSEKLRLDNFRKKASKLSNDYQIARTGDRTFDNIQEILKSLRLPDKKIGIVAYDHSHAFRILSESSALSLRPGKDFGLTSCDGTSNLFGSWPDLSRSNISRFDIGADCAELLVEIINSKKNHFPSKLIKPTFIKGNTA